MPNKREQIQQQAEELAATKQQLEEKGNELQQQDTTQQMQESDRRNEFKSKAKELAGLKEELTSKAQSIKNNTMASEVDSIAEMNEAINETRIEEIEAIRQKYKEGKENLDRRIIANDEWWKLRHFGQMSTKEEGQTIDKMNKEPASGWLFSSLVNKHADYMDNYPEASILPVEENDKMYAHQLSSVIPAIFDKNEYEQTYSNVCWYKLKTGTGVKCVVWNKNKENGLGDIDIKQCDILNMAWQPGNTNIQDSPYFFNTALLDNDSIIASFPDVEGLSNKLHNDSPTENKWHYDDTIDTTDKSVVVDCYYKTRNESGKIVVHLLKYTCGCILFCSQNEEGYENGYYEHGLYPFVFDVLYPEEGTPTGFGYIDIMKPVQKSIDDLNADILKNARASSRKRYVVNAAGGINEEEFANFDNDIIHATGTNLDQGNFTEIYSNPIAPSCVDFLNNKVDELKVISNNRDFANGGTTAGITAASAIAALQESGSKTSRDELKASYRAFSQEVYLVIELIRQFYDESRCFRITGETGEEYIEFNNQHIKTQELEDGNSRKPIYDIKVKVHKSSSFSRLAQNEDMKDLFKMGVFNPQIADQAVLLLSSMDFEGRDDLLHKIQQNGTMLQQIQQYQQVVMAMAQMLDSLTGSQYTQQAQMAIEAGTPTAIMSGASTNSKQSNVNSLGGETSTGNSIVDNARQATRERSAVK